MSMKYQYQNSLSDANGAKDLNSEMSKTSVPLYQRTLGDTKSTGISGYGIGQKNAPIRYIFI